jgi:hypothetical protein
MAVTRAGTVIKIAADNDTVAGPINVCGIKYIAGTGSPSIQIKETDTNGVVMWETASATSLYEEVKFRSNGTIHVDLAGTGTLLYIYTE